MKAVVVAFYKVTALLKFQAIWKLFESIGIKIGEL